jgi:predicted Zn-dependent peptidase
MPEHRSFISTETLDSRSNVTISIKLSSLQNYEERVLNQIFRAYLVGNNGYLERFLFRHTGSAYHLASNTLYWTNGGLLSITSQINSKFLDEFQQILSSFFSQPQPQITECDFIQAIEQTALHYRKPFSEPDGSAWWYGEDLLLTGTIFTKEKLEAFLENVTYERFINHVVKLELQNVEIEHSVLD